VDSLIPQYYRDYGLYVNNFRSFPLDLDGLKPVERRVLLVAYKIAKARFVKSARIDGTTIATYHPHGSSYGTVVQLAKQGFLDKQGNFGNNYGIQPSPPAAMRYTEAKLNSLINDMCFKYIDYVPWVDGELEEKEPQFIPTMYPLCLLGHEYTIGIGFGYRTYVPCFEQNDLYKRLLWLLGLEKKKPTIKIKTDCIILSKKSDMETLLTTGKSKIILQGRILVDASRCKAIIKSKPPGKKFEKILDDFKKELDNKDIGFIDSSNKVNGTSIVFTVLKQRNRDKIFKAFVEKLKQSLTVNVPFETIVTDLSENVSLVSVDDLLKRSFVMFSKVNEKMLNQNLSEIDKRIQELKYLALIKPELTSRLNMIRDDFDRAVSAISKNTKIDKTIVSDILSRYRIRKLFTFNTETKDLETQKAEFENNLNNIQEFVLNQYQEDI